MNKLLNAGFARLKKDKPFWIGIIFMAFIGAFTPIMRYFDAKSSGFDLPLDTCIFAYALLMVIVSSVFCSLYLGTEYNDGIIRNKLVVGHSRFAVYFSNLIVCSVSTILFQLVYLVVALPIGLPLLGLDMKVGFLLFMFFCILMMSLAYVAIFTIIGMLCQNKAVVAVICVLGTFIMLFVGIFINTKLSEPEFHEAYEYVNDAGEIEYVESEKNPYYLGGTKRKIYSFAYDFIPGCQTVQLSSMPQDSVDVLPAYAAVVILLTTAAGVAVFKKKDIK
ncbi:MAG: ABC transporter permease subunit [Clostridiales bacterium]|nr:ABC transporter permease subunit [Clostridiales bacterium]